MTKLLFPLFVAGAALLLPMQPTMADIEISGVGYNGSDLPGSAVVVSSPWSCSQQCAAWNSDPTKSGLQPCTLWSYYTGVVADGQNNCYLKTNTTQVNAVLCPTNNPFCAVSGTINTIVGPGMVGGVGYNGFDLSGGAVVVSSPYLCGQQCAAWNTDSSKSGVCTLWSYYTAVPSGNNCYLKTNTTQVTPAPACPASNPVCAVSGKIDTIVGMVSGVGYNGFDLPSSAAAVSSPWLCAQRCTAWNNDMTKSGVCTLWSYYTNIASGQNNCYIKTNVTQIAPAPCPPSNPVCAISGTVPSVVGAGMIGGVGYNGFDLPGSAVGVSSAYLCGQQCAAWNADPAKFGLPPCTLWSYYPVGIKAGPGQANCYLKTNTTQIDPAPACPSNNPLCAISGTINTIVGPGMVGGVGYNGFDLSGSGSAVVVSSPYLCGQQCAAWNADSSKSGVCTLWSYYTAVPSGNNCYLKTNKTQVNPAPACPASNPVCVVSGTNNRVIGGVGYNGFDIPGSGVVVSSPWLCAEECAAWNLDVTKSGLPTCTLWSYYAGVTPTGQSNCYLKTNTTLLNPAPCATNNPFCAVSGTITTIVGPGMVGGVGYNGFDLSGGAVVASSPYSCGQQCAAWNADSSKSGVCTLWSYYRDGVAAGANNCYLKTNTTQVNPVLCPANNPFCYVSGKIDTIVGMVPGVGYNGFDLPNSAISVSSPQSCAQLCVAWNADGTKPGICTLWSYYTDVAGGQNNNNCYLKSNITQVTPAPCSPSNPVCAVSGIINPKLVGAGMIAGVGYNGFDLPGSALIVSSPWLCGEQCVGWNLDPTKTGLPPCTLWSYYKDGVAAGANNCYLKTNTTQVDPVPCPTNNPFCIISGTNILQ